MVSALSLWAPILLSALLAFVASSVIHMFLTYHRKDTSGVPDEDGVMDALRGFDIAPGDYVIPHAGSPEAMRSEAFLEKVRRGPVVFMTVVPERRMTSMRGQLIQWYLYCALVGLFTACVTGLALAPGAEYMEVFRLASTTAFIGYALALLQRSIWYSQNWGATVRNMFDGLIYALLTGGTFGWLWP